MSIRYRSGYKYQLVNDYRHGLRFLEPRPEIETEFIQLSEDCVLTIRHGYAWDGPSGPAIDTKNFMRGSLIHDALYQLIRDGWLTIEDKEAADRELELVCLEDGMSRLRAWWVYQSVALCGSKSCLGDGGKPLMEAP